ARAAANVGHQAAAAVVYELLEPWESQVVWTGSSVQGPVALGLAQLAVVLGRTDAALRHLARADELAASWDAPPWTARARPPEARARAAKDPDDPAIVAAREAARTLAREHGFAGVEQASRG